jgi:hypothetical protein
MARTAFTLKTKAELKQISMLDLHLYIAELRRRASWVQGTARKSLEDELEQAIKERDARRASG